MSTAPPIFVLGRFPPPYDGQSVMTEQTAKILETGWNVVRINSSFQGNSHVEIFGQWNIAKFLHYPRVILRSRKLLRQFPDAPVVWPSISPTPIGHFRDLVAVLLAFRKTHNVYAAIHWGDFDRLFRSRLTRYTARLLVRRVRGFVFLDGLAEKCADWIPPEKRFTIPNTIDEATRCTDEEVIEKQSNRMRRESLNVLYLSNMIPSKGYLDVLAAMNILHTQGLRFHASFVGRWQSEQDQQSFMKQISDLRLDDCVTVHGGISDRPVLKRMYLDADAFVLPTYYPAEAQPLSILEAINSGTPVVTTRHAGIPSMLRESANEGLFVEPRNPQEIAESLRQINDVNRWRIYSNAAIQRFRSHFSPEAVREKWMWMLAQQ